MTTASRSSVDKSSADPLDRLRILAATHPYSAAFFLGSSLTIVFISAVGLTKSAFWPGSAVTARQVNEVWSIRYAALRRQFAEKLEADQKVRDDLVARLGKLEGKIEVLGAAVTSAETRKMDARADKVIADRGPTAPIVFKETVKPVFTSNTPSTVESPPPPKRPIQPYYGLRMGIGKMGPMPVITADNPNYITYAESSSSK